MILTCAAQPSAVWLQTKPVYIVEVKLPGTVSLDFITNCAWYKLHIPLLELSANSVENAPMVLLFRGTDAERERERERERDTHTHIHTYTHTHKHTQTHTNTHTNTLKHTQTHTNTHKHTDTHIHIMTDNNSNFNIENRTNRASSSPLPPPPIYFWRVFCWVVSRHRWHKGEKLFPPTGQHRYHNFVGPYVELNHHLLAENIITFVGCSQKIQLQTTAKPLKIWCKNSIFLHDKQTNQAEFLCAVGIWVNKLWSFSPMWTVMREHQVCAQNVTSVTHTGMFRVTWWGTRQPPLACGWSPRKTACVARDTRVFLQFSWCEVLLVLLSSVGWSVLVVRVSPFPWRRLLWELFNVSIFLLLKQESGFGFFQPCNVRLPLNSLGMKRHVCALQERMVGRAWWSCKDATSGSGIYEGLSSQSARIWTQMSTFLICNKRTQHTSSWNILVEWNPEIGALFHFPLIQHKIHIASPPTTAPTCQVWCKQLIQQEKKATNTIPYWIMSVSTQ